MRDCSSLGQLSPLGPMAPNMVPNCGQLSMPTLSPSGSLVCRRMGGWAGWCLPWAKGWCGWRGFLRVHSPTHTDGPVVSLPCPSLLSLGCPSHMPKGALGRWAQWVLDFPAPDAHRPLQVVLCSGPGVPGVLQLSVGVGGSR